MAKDERRQEGKSQTRRTDLLGLGTQTEATKLPPTHDTEGVDS